MRHEGPNRSLRLQGKGREGNVLNDMLLDSEKVWVVSRG